MYRSFELKLVVEYENCCEVWNGDLEELEKQTGEKDRFWTIYGRNREGFADALMDFKYNKKEAAEEMFDFLNILLDSHKKLNTIKAKIHNYGISEEKLMELV